MAAKALESSNKVWQRAFNFLAGVGTIGAREESIKALKALKLYLATFAGNPQLQYLSFSDVTTDQVTALNSGGATLYAIYVKKRNTATDAFFKFNDSATLSGAANGANMQGCIPLLVGRDEALLVLTPGHILATGLVVSSETTGAGGTDSTSGDGPDGFAIIG